MGVIAMPVFIFVVMCAYLRSGALHLRRDVRPLVVDKQLLSMSNLTLVGGLVLRFDVFHLHRDVRLLVVDKQLLSMSSMTLVRRLVLRFGALHLHRDVCAYLWSISSSSAC